VQRSGDDAQGHKDQQHINIVAQQDLPGGVSDERRPAYVGMVILVVWSFARIQKRCVLARIAIALAFIIGRHSFERRCSLKNVLDRSGSYCETRISAVDDPRSRFKMDSQSSRSHSCNHNILMTSKKQGIVR
jgi:hypothetical protein